MTIITLSSQNFDRDTSRAKEATTDGPVFISNRVKNDPSHPIRHCEAPLGTVAIQGRGTICVDALDCHVAKRLLAMTKGGGSLFGRIGIASGKRGTIVEAQSMLGLSGIGLRTRKVAFIPMARAGRNDLTVGSQSPAGTAVTGFVPMLIA